jgi:hypothetical protein
MLPGVDPGIVEFCTSIRGLSRARASEKHTRRYELKPNKKRRLFEDEKHMLIADPLMDTKFKSKTRFKKHFSFILNHYRPHCLQSLKN